MRPQHIVRTLTLFALLGAAAAGAYPTSVVFAPTGESKPLGGLGYYAYIPVLITPTVAPGATWAGIDVGVMPTLRVGDFELGGAEVGVDVINGFVAPGKAPTAKFVLNAKLQVVRELGLLPHIAVGLMEVDLGNIQASMNAAYITATKTIAIGDIGLGRFTLGGGYVGNADVNVYLAPGYLRGIGANQAWWLAGYESPAIGPFNFAIDHISGVSEASCTNVAVNWSATSQMGIMGGVSLMNERQDPTATYDAAFVSLWSTLNPFEKLLAAAPANEAPAVAAPAPTEATPVAAAATTGDDVAMLTP